MVQRTGQGSLGGHEAAGVEGCIRQNAEPAEEEKEHVEVADRSVNSGHKLHAAIAGVCLIK
jgi:hypothetical protein